MSLEDIPSPFFGKVTTMSIPFWRNVGYTNDGCSLTECLTCYNRWELRSNMSHWKYCPFCGTIWLGEKTVTQKEYYGHPDCREDRIYPLSFRIESKFIDTDGTDILPWNIAHAGLKGAPYAYKCLKDALIEEKQSQKEYPYLGKRKYRVRIDKKLL